MRWRKNNKGSTIVLVIVVLAIVGVLATVALWVSLQNYQMKINDRKVADSFYSAEGILDQVCAGLQKDVSEALDVSYKDMMENYASIEKADRTNYFQSLYVNTLRNNLQYTGASGSGVPGFKCKLSKLRGYVTMDRGKWKLVYEPESGAGSEDYCLLETKKNCIVLKGLRVEYVDTEGILSVIRSDVQLAIPELSTSQSAVLPDPFSYSLIGNGGIELLTGATGLKVSGSVYAGSVHALTEGTEESDYESFVVHTGADITFEDPVQDANRKLIVDGDLILYPTAELQTSPSGVLWSRNILVEGASATLLGTSYVADDLMMSGIGPYVSIGKQAEGVSPALQGAYVGYGAVSEDESRSSAIVINGKNSTEPTGRKCELDMSQAAYMILSGYSYIGTDRLAAGSGKPANGEVPMAGSISVKGDQIAYLVPAECVGTDAGGKSVYSKNPLSYTEYQMLVSSGATLVDQDVPIQQTGKKLSAYLGGKSINDAFRTVFVPASGSDGQVYFYLNLETEQAKKYFADYSSKNIDKLEKYTAFYTDAIRTLEDESNIYTAGLYATYDYEEAGVEKALSYAIGSDTSHNGSIGALADKYENLTTMLLEDVTTIPSSKLVYENIIKDSELKDFLSACPGNKFEGTDNTGDMKVILVNNPGSVYHFDSLDPNQKCLLIATGDVSVDISQPFVGTIIAKGKITFTGANLSIAAGETADMKAFLGTECTSVNGDKVIPYKFFVGADTDVSNGFVPSLGGNSVIDVSELITYSNWKKL